MIIFVSILSLFSEKKKYETLTCKTQIGVTKNDIESFDV
jgi:hypothetical protein